MAFNWEDYLTLAKGVSPSDSEAVKRSAASRAYYAAAHMSRLYAQRKFGWTFSKESFHANLSAKFRLQYGNVDHQEISSKLTRLRKIRVECDYDDSVSEIDKKLKTAKLEAENIKQLLANNP